MNKTVIAILAGLGGIAAYNIFLKPKDDKKNDSESIFGTVPQSAPPVDTVIEPPPPLSIDMGEGLNLIQSRAKVLFDNEGSQILSNLIDKNIYSGLSYPPGMKQIFSQKFGSPFSIPIYPEMINPIFNNGLKAYAQMGDIEVQQWQAGDSEQTLQNYISTFANAGNIAGVEFWPDNIKELVRQKLFGEQKKKDKNWSNNVENFNKDLKRFFENILPVSEKFNIQLRNKAINDLVIAGYSFIGV